MEKTKSFLKEYDRYRNLLITIKKETNSLLAKNFKEKNIPFRPFFDITEIYVLLNIYLTKSKSLQSVSISRSKINISLYAHKLKEKECLEIVPVTNNKKNKILRLTDRGVLCAKIIHDFFEGNF